jgi:hypothetical protein
MQRGQSRQRKRQLLVLSEQPSLSSAGSRPGCFHTSLGCEPSSLMRVSLGCSIIQKNVRKDNPTDSMVLRNGSTTKRRVGRPLFYDKNFGRSIFYFWMFCIL